MNFHRNRLLCLGLAAIIAGSVTFASLPAADPAPAPKATPIPKVTQPMKIDGALDEPIWKEAVPVRADYIYGKVAELSKEPRMIVKYTWDDDYLYIGYETFDEDLVALESEDVEGPPTNKRKGLKIHHPDKQADVVEFFISFGDEHYFWELHHNAANQFNDIWIAAMDDKEPITKTTLARFGIHFGFGEALQDDIEAAKTLAIAAKPKLRADGQPSTINDSSDKDTGYTAELRIPWFGLGGPTARESFIVIEPKEVGGPKKQYHGPWKMAGQELMILGVMQNGDIKDHYHHSSPTLPGGWFHKGPTHWPRYLLEPPAQK